MLHIVDLLLFIIFAIWVVYLLIFAVASLFPLSEHQGDQAPRRIAVLIPAYKEDSVIVECALSALGSNYPRDMTQVVVIADRMMPQTLERLHAIGSVVLEVDFENSTKAKALNFAMSRLGDNFDIALILDADNTITPEVIGQINRGMTPDLHAIQAHRMAKNSSGRLALLDAASEEINNSIFRKGHVRLGLSAALIGSGMAFRYGEFKEVMASVAAVGGFDKELEHIYLERHLRIGYLPHATLLDEKVSRTSDFSNQRRRWMSAQVHYLSRYISHFVPAIARGNIDFADKIFQMMTPPRVLLLGSLVMISLIILIFSAAAAIKWIVLSGLLGVALAVSVPRRLYTLHMLRAVLYLPWAMVLMALNLLKLRGANRHFIHTSHGNT